MKLYHIHFIRTTCTPAFIPLVLAKPTLLTIHFGKHGIKVVKHPPLQHLLYEISDFVYDAAHLSYENRLESCGITVCATMIMPPPLISCVIPK